MSLGGFSIEKLIFDIRWLVLRTVFHGQILRPYDLHLKRIQIVSVYLSKKWLIRRQSKTKSINIENPDSFALKLKLNHLIIYLRLSLIDSQERTIIEVKLVLNLIILCIDKIAVKLLLYNRLAEILDKKGGTSSILSRSNSL